MTNDQAIRALEELAAVTWESASAGWLSVCERADGEWWVRFGLCDLKTLTRFAAGYQTRRPGSAWAMPW